MFDHEDRLGSLHQNVSLVSKVQAIHAALRARFDFVQRIAAAVYDPGTDAIQTFLHTGEESTPLTHYSAKLSDAPSLHEIVEKGRPRVVNDLSLFAESGHEHAQRVAASGYRSSYTMPMYHQGKLFGFLFFNAYETDCFGEEVLSQIDPFGHLIALTIINDLTTMHTLLASVKTARDMAHARDGETGSHLDRMSRFARIIAQAVADRYALSDETIERIFIFSPLHDIGKIAIPDRVLLKPGKLDADEEALMRTHPARGRDMIDQMLTHFDAAVLKLDRAFMEDLPGNADNQARIREMAGKARELGKTTIAEFVQDAGSMSILFGAGVDYAQGHFLAASGPNMDYEF